MRVLAISAALVGLMMAGAAVAQVQVRGHTRSDGTYVAPHTRSAPNNSTYDNRSAYSTPSYRAPSYNAPQPLYGSSRPSGTPASSCSGLGCYGESSTANGRPRTTTVDGYVRRDGTYVAPYARSPQ